MRQYCRDGKVQMMRLSHGIARVANLSDFFTFADKLEKPHIGFLHVSVILNSPVRSQYFDIIPADRPIPFINYYPVSRGQNRISFLGEDVNTLMHNRLSPWVI